MGADRAVVTEGSTAGWPLVGPPQDPERILFRERTGVPWADLPERYSWPTVYNWFRRRSLDATFDRILDHVVVKGDAVGAVEWEVSIDSSIVRAHQHAAGAPHAVPKARTGIGPSTGTPRTPPSGRKPSAALGAADQQDPCRGRRSRPPPVPAADRQADQRLHPARAGHGRYPGTTRRTGPATDPP
ncbi:hypothetical protein FAGKG844_220013 [Frankia sp. AgKG'84/4]